MDEPIESTSVEIYARQPVSIRAPYSRKLKEIAEAEHRSMTAQAEFLIEQEWQRMFTPLHVSEPTVEQDIERRR
jgi:hypothetical protein